MNDFLEILKVTLPAIIVAVAVLFAIFIFFKDGQARRSEAFDGESHKIFLNLRLQAYERIALFLERISPQQLVMRLSKPGMAGLQLQWEILKTINEEFEHNFSQQIYLSPQVWDLVKIAKESVIRQINISASTLDEVSTGDDLARKILENEMNQKSNQINEALAFLKKEVQQLF